MCLGFVGEASEDSARKKEQRYVFHKVGGFGEVKIVVFRV
jgi:hypothetical protein